MGEKMFEAMENKRIWPWIVILGVITIAYPLLLISVIAGTIGAIFKIEVS